MLQKSFQMLRHNGKHLKNRPRAGKFIDFLGLLTSRHVPDRHLGGVHQRGGLESHLAVLLAPQNAEATHSASALKASEAMRRAAPMDHDGRVLHRLRRLSGLHDLRTLGLRLLGLTALQGLQLLQRLLPPSPSPRAPHQGSCILGSMLWLGGSGGSGFGSGGGGVSGFTYTLQQQNHAKSSPGGYVWAPSEPEIHAKRTE